MSAIGRTWRRPRCLGVLLHRPADPGDEGGGDDERDDVGDDRRAPPNAWLNRPPSPAPTASITPHVEPKMALAARSSSRLRARLGTAASIAGLTKAARAATVPWKTNATQIRSADSSSRPDAASAWASSTMTSSRCRSTRSTTGPASGEARNDGSDIDTSTSETSSSDPVTSSTYPARATNRNQSPRNEMTWAQNSRRMSRLLRSSWSTASLGEIGGRSDSRSRALVTFGPHVPGGVRPTSILTSRR